jgi:hypothetical protein
MELQHSEIVLNDPQKNQDALLQVQDLNDLHLALIGGGNATVVFT